MASTGLLAVVVAPPASPPRGATLLRSANLPADTDGRWLSGLTWRPNVCGDQDDTVKVVDACAQLAAWPVTDDPPNPESYIPPHVAVGMDCSAISGAMILDETVDMARALLERAQTIGIARELWRGDAAVSATPDLPNPYLAESAGLTQPKGTTVTAAVRAFAELEDYLADCSFGGVGMIHATPRTVTVWHHARLIDRQPDGRIMSVLGTLIVADPGYDGSAPDGTVTASGDDAWAYATGMVDVRLGPVQVLGADGFTGVNRSNNDFSVYAARPFAATFDPCCRAGIRVNHASLI